MNRFLSTIAIAAIALAALILNTRAQSDAASQSSSSASEPSDVAVAIFAGGCFWCMEPPFDKLPGVLETTSGYTDGEVVDPTYKQVSAGRTGHTEAVEIRYDPTKVSYEELLAVFWKIIDPLAVDRQFCDRGSQYRSGIYYATEQEKALAEASAARVAAQFDKPIATEIKPASEFYAAEEYHQDYYLKNPIRYKFYRSGCGRDARLEELWGKG
ncbi:MAG: peptide-methionine (S)-S-oxide reductase MsrA [Pseudomonadota bacterium]